MNNINILKREIHQNILAQVKHKISPPKATQA